eukprot:COSAG06_NODE_24230_length_668_cov_2.462214_1_plen_154_part_10
MQARDVTEHAVDRLGGRPALSLGFRQSEGVPVEPHEEQERVVLAELEVLVDRRKRGDLGELLGEQGAEPCRHLVTYVHKVCEVGRDLRIVFRELRVQYVGADELEDTSRASSDDGADMPLAVLKGQQQPDRSRTRTECVGAAQLSSWAAKLKTR